MPGSCPAAGATDWIHPNGRRIDGSVFWGRRITRREKYENRIRGNLSFLLDLLLGDPMWMPHPVVFMGKCITKLEKFLRRALPDTETGLLWGGRILAFCLPVGTLIVSGGAIWLLGKLHPALGFLLGVFWAGRPWPCGI